MQLVRCYGGSEGSAEEGQRLPQGCTGEIGGEHGFCMPHAIRPLC